MPTVEAGFQISPFIQNPFIPFQMMRPNPLVWNYDIESAFKTLTTKLITAPPIGNPSDCLPFLLWSYMKLTEIPLVCLFSARGKCSPISYYIQKLELITQGHPPCLWAIATTATLLWATEETVTGSSLQVFVSHSIAALVNSYYTQHLIC